MEKNNPYQKIVVSGGGFAALGCALACAHYDMAPILVRGKRGEVPLAARHEASVLALSPASKNMLARLGVWSFMKTKTRIEEIQIFGAGGGCVNPALLWEKNPDRSPFAYIVPASELYGALCKKIDENKAIRQCYAMSESFSASAHGGRLVLEGGEVIETPLCLVAEGAKSRLRQTANIGVLQGSYGQYAMTALLAHEEERLIAAQAFLPTGPMALLPLAPKKSALIWSVKGAAFAGLREMAPARFCRQVAEYFPKWGGFRLQSERGAFALRFMLARQYVGKRLALIGESAHLFHPLAGQGFNLSLRDCASIAERLSYARGLGLDPASPAVLKEYEVLRRFDGVAMGALTHVLAKKAGLIPFGVVNRLPVLKRFFAKSAQFGTSPMPPLMR